MKSFEAFLPKLKCCKRELISKKVDCLLLGIQKAQALNFLSITLHLHHSLILQCDCMLSQWNAHYRNSVSQISFCASKIIIARRHQKKKAWTSDQYWSNYYYDWKRTENFFVQSTKVHFDHISSGDNISVYACMHTWANHDGS